MGPVAMLLSTEDTEGTEKDGKRWKKMEKDGKRFVVLRGFWWSRSSMTDFGALHPLVVR